MSIPIRPRREPDPLDVFVVEKAHWGQTSRSSQLDLRAYWTALRENWPIPTFQMLDVKCEKAVGRPRLVDEQLLARILADGQNAEEVASITGVDLLVIHDLRRRAEPGTIRR